ncbi:MAG: DUF4199 domain-containing protein [Salegentibacter sp.]
MKRYSVEIKWGIIFIVAQICWMIFEKAMGWHDELIAKQAIYTNFFAIIAIGIYLLELYEKRKKIFMGHMNWQQGFVSGIILTAVITILTPFAQYIITQFITPEYFDNIISYSVKNGRMSQENAEALFNLKSYVVQATFGALGYGVVTAAIAALIMKRK